MKRNVALLEMLLQNNEKEILKEYSTIVYGQSSIILYDRNLSLNEIETLTAAFVILLARYTNADTLSILIFGKKYLINIYDKTTVEQLYSILKLNQTDSGEGSSILSDNFGMIELREKDADAITRELFSLIIDPLSSEISIKYDTRFFEKKFIIDLIENFHKIFSSIKNSMDSVNIHSLPVISDYQYAEILKSSKLNFRSELSFERDDLFLSCLFENQVKRSPFSVAIIDMGRSYTYDQLNKYANKFASYLDHIGIKRGDSVLISFERSLELYIALLGTIKLGATYVPIDPHNPIVRINYFIEDSLPKIVLAEDSIINSINASSLNTQAIYMTKESILSEISKYPDQDISRAISRDDIIYVIYTSGSTGKPKGVMVKQENISNFLLDMKSRFMVSANDVFLNITSIGFNMSQFEMFVPLISGSKLVLAENGCSSNGQKLADIVEAHGVTILEATPSTWKILLDSGWTGRNGLKMLTAGEPLTEELSSDLIDKGGELWNLYGSTETTVYSTFYRVRKGEQVSIGKCISNVGMYILDKNLQHVPIDVLGDIWITGQGVAAGYLNREELTREKFIDNPYIPGYKMYKMGDVARKNYDGKVILSGRSDYQVKVRGNRVELLEIEAVLRKHSKVSQAAVILSKKNYHHEQLIAFIILHDDKNDNVLIKKELYDYLSSQLPEYMVPIYYKVILEFPLNSSRKIDRPALESIDVSSAVVGCSERPHGMISDLNKEIVKIISSLCNLDEDMMSMNIPLKYYGIDSVNLPKLVRKLNDRFTVQLSFSDIKTIDSISEVISQSKNGEALSMEEEIYVSEENQMLEFASKGMVEDSINDIIYKILTINEVLDAADVIAETFAGDSAAGEPMSKKLKITPNEMREFIIPYCELGAMCGTSLIAINSKTNSVIGAMIAYNYDKEVCHKNISPKFNPILSLLKKVSSPINVLSKLEKSKILYQLTLGVKDDSPPSVAYYLCKLLLQVGKNNGMVMCAGELTGPVSKSFFVDSMGYEVHEPGIVYDQFEYNGERVFEGIGREFRSSLSDRGLSYKENFSSCFFATRSLTETRDSANTIDKNVEHYVQEISNS